MSVDCSIDSGAKQRSRVPNSKHALIMNTLLMKEFLEVFQKTIAFHLSVILTCKRS